MLGAVVVKPDAVEDALALSRAHVARSRTEPGCVTHDVHVDAEHPQRLVFVERWADHPALMTHFAVSASNEFIEAITALAVEPPSIEIYEATKL